MTKNISSNEMKLQVLSDLGALVDQVQIKRHILCALDRDTSEGGGHELHAELYVTAKQTLYLEQAIKRATSICSTGKK